VVLTKTRKMIRDDLSFEHRRRLSLGLGGTKVTLNFGGERWKKCAFKHIYFTLVPIKCFQCLKT